MSSGVYSSHTDMVTMATDSTGTDTGLPAVTDHTQAAGPVTEQYNHLPLLAPDHQLHYSAVLDGAGIMHIVCRKCGTGGYLLTSTSNREFDSCATDSSVLTNQRGPGNRPSPLAVGSAHWQKRLMFFFLFFFYI
ncbi:hypothetical protein INR49_007125 [Caranx melampygus]|nr:hypothetical protein INR49_007125 [Caranx melampygus]